MRRSKPSGPRNPRNARATSAASWKTPEPADVLSYSYLWSHEAAGGGERAKGSSRVVVVLCIERQAGNLILVSVGHHTAPEMLPSRSKIHLDVKKQLGLDRERSWVMLNELNRFIWPGPDIRPILGGAPLYDALPDWLFERVRQGVLDHNAAGKLKVTSRTE